MTAHTDRGIISVSKYRCTNCGQMKYGNPKYREVLDDIEINICRKCSNKAHHVTNKKGEHSC